MAEREYIVTVNSDVDITAFDAEMVSKALEFIESDTFDLVFAAFDSVDLAGHSQVR